MKADFNGEMWIGEQRDFMKKMHNQLHILSTKKKKKTQSGDKTVTALVFHCSS
jgi:hypothetical protein